MLSFLEAAAIFVVGFVVGGTFCSLILIAYMAASEPDGGSRP